jgi:hypothetical protein
MNYNHGPKNIEAHCRFMANPSVGRMFSFANGRGFLFFFLHCTYAIPAGFAYYSPKMYRYYKEMLEKVLKHHPELERLCVRTPGPGTTGEGDSGAVGQDERGSNGERDGCSRHRVRNTGTCARAHNGGGGGGRAPGIWATSSANHGPQAAAYLHNNSGNLAHRWCAIQALGDYDPKKGGHLILLQLGLIVEFPPGSTVLIPLLTVTHGNLPIAPHEKRASLVHFTPGGLFRWVEYGFHTEGSFKAEDRKGFDAIWAERTTVCLDGVMDMFSKVYELEKDRIDVFGT